MLSESKVAINLIFGRSVSLQSFFIHHANTVKTRVLKLWLLVVSNNLPRCFVSDIVNPRPWLTYYFVSLPAHAILLNHDYRLLQPIFCISFLVVLGISSLVIFG